MLHRLLFFHHANAGVFVVLDILFLIITGSIAYHALTHRNADGGNDIGHMLFGAIALLFFMRVLLVDVFRFL
ncbi:MAG: hypothetical protein AB2812_08295 [Candidatus Sedimenticola endophacoides]